MLGLLGYNFLSDKNALDELPTNVTGITSTILSNGVYNHYNVELEAESDYSNVIPTAWDYNTLMDADFNGDINASNLDDSVSDITEIRIKRRVKGEFDWITIKSVVVNDVSDINIVFNDNTNMNITQYEYAFVPVMNGIEGGYSVSEVWSEFRGVYICDVNTIYKFYAGVEYGNTDAVQQIGVYTPFGSRYPVVVSNGLINYQTGSINGYILSDDKADLELTGDARKKLVARRNQLVKFLTNKKPKIIKDWNGQAWLCIITGNPSTSYISNTAMGLMRISADWTEVGDVNNQEDLYANGLLDIANRDGDV